MQMLSRPPADLQPLFKCWETYDIIYSLAKLEHQLQVCPEVTNSAWSYQHLPDFLMVRLAHWDGFRVVQVGLAQVHTYK